MEKTPTPGEGGPTHTTGVLETVSLGETMGIALRPIVLH